MTLSHNDLPPDDRTMKKIIKKKKKSFDSNISMNSLEFSSKEETGIGISSSSRVSDSDSEMEDVSDDYLKSSSELSEELSDMYSSNDEYDPNTSNTSTTILNTSSTKRPTKKIRSPDNSPPSSTLPSLQHSPQDSTLTTTTTSTSTTSMNQESSSIVYCSYSHQDIKGWEQYAHNVAYSTQLLWTDPNVIERSRPSKLLDFPSFCSLSISSILSKSIDEPTRIALIAETDIPENLCLGEYTGEVTETISYKKYSYRLSETLEIDASLYGNELRFISDSFSRQIDPNVKFDLIDGHIYAVTLRKINIGEELVADFGDEYRDRVAMYIDICEKIDLFNMEHLSEEERKSSAFEWFINDGYKLLKTKGKITVPVHNRFPAKKGLANTLQSSKLRKNEIEWGYVAQLEKLDLERAREDCWVTFRAGRHWNFNALDSAINAWKVERSKNTQDLLVSKKKLLLLQDINSSINNTNNNIISTSTSNTTTINNSLVPIQEINLNDLNMNNNNNNNNSYWKGCPVNIKYFTTKSSTIATTVSANRQLNSNEMTILQTFKFSEMSHPNIVSCHGYCNSKESGFLLVKEYMNMGSLRAWLSSTPLSKAMQHIPKIALDIARAMEHIHSKGYYWGNLNSSNVLLRGYLNEQGNGYLEAKIDFDCLSLLEDILVDEEDIKASSSSDIYNFGMLLCQLFTEGIGQELCQSLPLPIQYKDLIADCTKNDSNLKFSHVVNVLAPLVPF